jgi:formylglycine-generating enzyme required for sulfatase activity
MKKILLFIVLSIMFVACNKPAGELTGLGIKNSFIEANPYGMVYIKRGTFMMGPNDQSVLGTTNDKQLNVTVDAFWMDETEITNDKYKQFVYWVRDSIALRSLVMTGKDEYRLKIKNQVEEPAPEVAPLNMKARIPWNSKDEEIQKILGEFYYNDPNSIESKKQLNPIKLKYRYSWIDYAQAALPYNKYDITTDSYGPRARVRIDTAYTDENGMIHNKTIERPLRSRRDLISTQIVDVYPDTIMWIRDFQYTYNDPRMKMYFSSPGFANYPVVGVSWEQAKAFCNWRTRLYNSANQVAAQEYRLPTEAEWEYAARGGHKMALYPWGGNSLRNSKGCFYANFKTMRGNYMDDAGTTTMKVASFPANDYGLYDMAGNVAEWTSSAFSGSSNTLVGDLNPTYQYNAKSSDPQILKRKVVKGGSWKDVAYFLECGVRTYEYQNESRPYIGFRCVRSYNGE